MSLFLILSLPIILLRFFPTLISLSSFLVCIWLTELWFPLFSMEEFLNLLFCSDFRRRMQLVWGYDVKYFLSYLSEFKVGWLHNQQCHPIIPTFCGICGGTGKIPGLSLQWDSSFLPGDKPNLHLALPQDPFSSSRPAFCCLLLWELLWNVHPDQDAAAFCYPPSAPSCYSLQESELIWTKSH